MLEFTDLVASWFEENLVLLHWRQLRPFGSEPGCELRREIAASSSVSYRCQIQPMMTPPLRQGVIHVVDPPGNHSAVLTPAALEAETSRLFSSGALNIKYI
jgi:hypothetical protein